MILRRFHTFQTLLREKPINLKNKKPSSQQWLVRQLKDPYVEKAKQYNYRCRSAFKLLEINEKHKIFEPGMYVIDIGAAPGSWTQVATRLTNADGMIIDEPKGKVIAIDKLPIHHIEGGTIFGNMDFTTEKAQKVLRDCLEGKFVDLVMSDMAPNASGVKGLDHENILKLAYAAFKFALEITAYQGSLILKVWDGGMSSELEKNVSKFYRHVKIVRPQATRDESSEKFILARGFKGISEKSSAKQ